MEETLRSSEMEHRKFLSNIPGAAYELRIDANGSFSFPFIEEEIVKITGYTPEEINNDPQRMLNNILQENPDSIKKIRQFKQNILQTLFLELKLTHKNGETRWILNIASPFRSKNGAVVWNGFIIDKTEQKFAEFGLRESNQLLWEVLKHSSDAVFIIDITPEDRFKINSFNTVAGKTIKPKSNKNSGSFIEDCFNKELADRLIGNYLHCLHTGNTLCYDESFDIESRRCYFNTTLVPIKDYTGRIYRIIGISHEITNLLQNEKILRELEIEQKNQASNPESEEFLNTLEENILEMNPLLEAIKNRKQTEDDLKHAATEWRTTFDSISDYVCLLDNDYRIIRMNKAFANLFNLRFQDLLGKHCYEIFHGKKGSPQNCIHRKILETKKPNMEEYYEPRLKMHIQESASPILDDNKQVLGTVLVLRDITETKHIEAERLELETLKRLNTAKNELLSDVAHELRTPLTTIKGNIESLIEQDVKWSKERQMEFLMDAHKEADHLILLIKDLLDMSRIESGKLALNKTYCTLEDIFNSANSRLNSITRDHRFKIILSGELPRIFVDKTRIGEVITNLVENATKFSEKGSLITIRARVQFDDLIISIKDQGIGIPKEEIEKLFDRFYRTSQAVSGRIRGTGLGLAICKGIVESHGGKIWVKSKPEKGSTFSFSIPLFVQEKENSGTEERN